jgi:flagellar basal-body rod modification protein FlgD
MIDQIGLEDVYASKNTQPVKDNSGSFSNIGAEDFFNLLIAKLEHQDPMNPMDDTTFISQVTQFTQLEELRTMKNTLKTMLLSQGASSNAQAVDLLNKFVVSKGNSINITSENSEGRARFDIDKSATEVSMVIYDDEGNVVNVKSLGSMLPGTHSITWDGKDMNGNSVPLGKYRYEIKAYQGTDEIDATTYSINLVDGISFKDGAVILKSGDMKISLPDVIEVII